MNDPIVFLDSLKRSPIWLASCQPCAVSTSAFVDANESRLLDHMILDLIEKLTAV
jgi:hypothetical protein